MNPDRTRVRAVAFLFGILPTVWIALLAAPYLSLGLPGILKGFSDSMNAPFQIRICPDTPRSLGIFALAYLLVSGVILSDTRRFRQGEEHGSAAWGSPQQLCARYADRDFFHNRILTMHVRIGMDARRHGRNLNVMVIGGSGSGKTRFYAKPNLMNARGSYIVLDPKGELLRDTGGMLERQGYEIRVLDLIHMDRSHGYNPFLYLMNDNDIQRLVTNLFRNTTPREARGTDPFWDQAAQILLLALVFYLKYEAPPEEQNFAMVMEMLRQGEVREDSGDYESPLDVLFSKLAQENPDHIAVKYYRSYRSGEARTLRSIQITLISHLEKFNLESVARLTAADELELDRIGERKTALFAVIPDNDSSFNFLVGMLYTQLFQQLYYRADNVYGGRLPVPVHFLMDEFANIALPSDFDKLLSTMRSREISVSIILQNLAQLRALYEKEWESVVGNCDELLFLGGNESSTHEMISKALGEETIDVMSVSENRGRSGSTGRNYSRIGRKLLEPDEVRRLDNASAVLLIRGEKPILDRKFDLMTHPSLPMTADGGAPPYRHGEEKTSIASVMLDRGGDIVLEDTGEEADCLILTGQELEELIDGKLEEIREYRESREEKPDPGGSSGLSRPD